MQVEAGGQDWGWKPEPETGANKHKCATQLADGLYLTMLKYFEVMFNRASRALLQRYAKFSRPLYNNVLTSYLARIVGPSFNLICNVEQKKICSRRQLVLKCETLILIPVYKNAKLNIIQKKFKPA